MQERWSPIQDPLNELSLLGNLALALAASLGIIVLVLRKWPEGLGCDARSGAVDVVQNTVVQQDCVEPS